MTARGRVTSSTDWDPMRDDFNNSSYDAQYQDNDNNGQSAQSYPLDHRKLYVTNVPVGLNEQGLRSAFEKYGQLEQAFLSRDPNKKFGLIRYETPAEARIAMMKLNRTEPLNLHVHFAHAKQSNNEGQNNNSRGHKDSVSTVSRRSRNQEEPINGEMEDPANVTIDRDFHIELEQIKLEKLKIQEEQLMCRQKMMLLQMEKRPVTANSTVTGSSRRLLPDGRVIVQERVQEPDMSFTAGAGDSNETTCSCQKSWTKNEESDEGSSTPSTCVLCSEDRSRPTQSKKNSIEKSETKSSEYSSKIVPSKTTDITVSKSMFKQSQFSKDVVSKRSDATSKKCEARKCPCKARSDMTCDLKFRDFYSDDDDEADETNRLIQLRNSDYIDIVDDQLKLVIALAGYPKSKMRLRQMELFQRCLTDVINMQLKANLLKKIPSFLDYYLNRGAIVCVCKDLDTRDWMVRVSPGLQERMNTNLVLLNSKVKRLCLAVLKIPRSCWPATAQDCFKLLQYFNPSLRTSSWKIYAQKVVDDAECTSFLIDRVSGEIIRGPTFKNVVDYDQMEFELTGYSEIYYECLLAGMEEDLSSVTSRVKLLEEIKSAGNTPRLASTVSVKSIKSIKSIEIQDLVKCIVPENKSEEKMEIVEVKNYEEEEYYKVVRQALEKSLGDEVLKKIKDVQYIGENNEVLVWSDETNAERDRIDRDEIEKDGIVEDGIERDEDKQTDYLEDINTTTTSLVALSEKSESIAESCDNLLIKTSTINIDSNRGIAYHRRTNYLHVENELKVAITLEGYPQNKLEGTHIRRLKHLFKEYLHKDMKSQRFGNLIIPKFQDIYLSNGAVIYICDSLETKDYLTEVLPKFVNSTGLKLTFREITNLVRYTRIVMRLPKEQANVESLDILSKLQEKYPSLKPDCWKYYSDVAGKQKRQFGVDPESLDVIKSPCFDPVYDGKKLEFRIIDRQKRDVSYEESNKNEMVESVETKKQRQVLVKNMYAPIDQEITKTPLTRIRTNHYSDLIADDLKLYVGPINYPDSRIDEIQFHSIKRAFENILMSFLEKGDMSEDNIPKFHDMYLFDGVIFIICQSMDSRIWIENNVDKVNDVLDINLIATEFRGAVGIVSMVVRTDKDTDSVIAILQKQNPRLRTKYWRKISTVKTNTKLDVVLQIDKLSAQIILDPSFNKLVGYETAQFKLGHLQSLIKPKSSLEELTKARDQKLGKKQNKALKNSKKKAKKSSTTKVLAFVDNKKDDFNKDKDASDTELDESPKLRRDQTQKEIKSNSDLDPNIVASESPKENSKFGIPEGSYQSKIILKIPLNILPDNEDDLNIVFDILEDKNPGLNTEIWQVFTESAYPNNGKFILYVDKQSLAVIQNKEFDPSVGGEKLIFYF